MLRQAVVNHYNILLCFNTFYDKRFDLCIFDKRMHARWLACVNVYSCTELHRPVHHCTSASAHARKYMHQCAHYVRVYDTTRTHTRTRVAQASVCIHVRIKLCGRACAHTSSICYKNMLSLFCNVNIIKTNTTCVVVIKTFTGHKTFAS